MNFAAINSSINTVRRFYATSGQFGDDGSVAESSAPGTSGELLSWIKQNTATLMELAGAITSLQRNGVRGYFPMSELQEQLARLKAIRDDATVKP